MTDFITLSFTSTREIPTFSSTWNLKKVPLSGGASPYRILKGVPHGEKVLFYILSRRYAEKTRRRTTPPNFVGGEGAALHRLRSTITWGCIIHFPVSLVYIKMHRRSLQLQMHLRQMRKESQQISLMIYCHCKLFYKPKGIKQHTCSKCSGPSSQEKVECSEYVIWRNCYSRSISYATRYLSRLLVFVSVNTVPKSCGRSFLFTQTIRHLGSEDQSKHRAGRYCSGVRISPA